MSRLWLIRFTGFFLSLLLAYLMCRFSFYALGEKEPWDLPGKGFAIYLLILVVIGFLSALIAKGSYLLLWLGVLLGQFIYVVFDLGGGPLMFFGVFYIAVYSLAALAGALVVSHFQE